VQASPAATPENLMSWGWQNDVSFQTSSSRAKSQNARRTHLVLSNHDLLDRIALAQLNQRRVVEGTRDFPTSDQRKSLDSLEIGVLDRHDARLGKERFGIVVDKLSVDEAGNTVRLDLCDLGLHLLL
jgi:hypothetical protein